MSSENFKPKRTAAASRGFLATARLSCLEYLQEVTLCSMAFLYFTCSSTCEIKLKQKMCFISADNWRDFFISVLFQRLAHMKQNADTIIVGVPRGLKQLGNKSKTFQSFSVSFQFHFTCASGLSLKCHKPRQISLGPTKWYYLLRSVSVRVGKRSVGV